MAHESGLKDTSSIQVNCDSSDSTLEINIKTLDLQIYSFRVKKNMPISALKEEIVTKIGAPLERQRLLYRGKLLKDGQLLSELHLEDGDTMHLVARQPVLFQPTSSTVVTDASRASSSQGAGAESSQNTFRIPSDNLADGGFTFLNPPMPVLQTHLSALLQRVDCYSDPIQRARIQFGARRLAGAMHNLGAMFLELGRVTMYLHMGQTPEESFVYAGPAVYISTTGPNPITVQPSPYQPSSLFGYNPARLRIQQSVPVRSNSEVFGSTIVGGTQRDEPTSGSDSVPTPVGQDTADIPNVLSRNAQVQSSSNATQSFHAFVRSGTQSDMSNVLGSDSQSQNPLSRPETSEGSSNREVNELFDLEDLHLVTQRTHALDSTGGFQGQQQLRPLKD